MYARLHSAATKENMSSAELGVLLQYKVQQYTPGMLFSLSTLRRRDDYIVSVCRCDMLESRNAESCITRPAQLH